MTYTDYLQHHGILGMKWGKRNGPPYPLSTSQMSAKERANNQSLATSGQNSSKQEGNREAASDINSKRQMRRSARKLSDEELKVAIERAKKEKELRSLQADSISNGRAFVKAMLTIGGTVAVTTLITSLARKWGENTSNRMTKRNKQERLRRLAEAKALSRAKEHVYGMPTKIDMSTLEGHNQYIAYSRNVINHIMQSQGFDKAFK